MQGVEILGPVPSERPWDYPAEYRLEEVILALKWIGRVRHQVRISVCTLIVHVVLTLIHSPPFHTTTWSPWGQSRGLRPWKVSAYTFWMCIVVHQIVFMNHGPFTTVFHPLKRTYFRLQGRQLGRNCAVVKISVLVMMRSGTMRMTRFPNYITFPLPRLRSPRPPRLSIQLGVEMLRRRQTLVDPKRPDVKVHKIKHRQTPSVVSVTSRPPHPDDEHPHDDLLNTAGDDDDKPSSPNVGQSTSAKSTMRAKSILSLATLPLRNGHVFALCVLLVFMQAGFYTGRVDKEEQLLLVTPEIQEALKQPLEVLTGRRSRGVIDGEHPIPQLMEEAEARFRRKVGRQSKTLKSAVAEYRKRYGRPAPKGFDKWWAFVQRHEVRMVDEYDGLMSDLEPFWKLSPTELKRRTMQVRRKRRHVCRR